MPMQFPAEQKGVRGDTFFRQSTPPRIGLLFVVRLSSDETLDPISSAAVFVASVVKCENHTQITEGGEKRLIDLIEKRRGPHLLRLVEPHPPMVGPSSCSAIRSGSSPLLTTERDLSACSL